MDDSAETDPMSAASLELSGALARAQAAVRQCEARYARLLESITDYVYEVKVEAGQATETRHGAGSVAITGFSPEDYAANPLLWHRMVHEEDRRAVEDQAERVLRGEAVQPLEHRILHKDGTVRWLRNTPVPRHDESGLLVGYDGLVSDITARRTAEEALRESEAKYRTLFRAATDAIFVESLDGDVLECNERACEMFGYREEELTRLNVTDLVPPDVAATLPEVVQAQLEGGGIHIEALNRRRSGDLFPCEVSTRLTTIGGQQRVIAYVHDITERTEAEDARLRQREAEARAAAAEASAIELEREIGRRRLVEDALKQRSEELAERVKELHCLFEISRCLENQDKPLEELLAEVLALVPPAFRDPSATCARVELDDIILTTPDWRPGRWRLQCPIAVDNLPAGSISVAFLAPWDDPVVGPFPIENTRLLEVIAARLGAVAKRTKEAQRVRQLQREITDLPAKEQRQIGQELHDNLGQQITGTALLVKSLWQRLAARGMAEAADARQIYDLIQEAHAQTRALSRGLIPVEVDAKGLMRALEELVASRDRLVTVSCRFVCQHPVTVDDNNVATQLYRIAQEAITNAIRHGHPGRVEVRLRSTATETVLEVGDDGSGLSDGTDVDSGTGIGIMRFRANAIGAELTIGASPAGGTLVTCRLPHPHRT